MSCGKSKGLFRGLCDRRVVQKFKIICTYCVLLFVSTQPALFVRSTV